MKKFIPALIVSIVVAFVVGCQCGYHGCESKYDLIEANANTIPYKIEVINAQRAALDAADHVIGEHNLFDTDGGDTMAKYLDLAHKVDSLYQLGE